MRRSALVFCFLVVMISLAVVLPPVRDELRWLGASYSDHAADYSGYLESFPTGRHSVEATQRQDDRLWIEAKAVATPQSISAYLLRHPGGRHATTARVRLDALRWWQARSSDTAQSLSAYLTEFPNGKYRQQAIAALDHLAFEAAKNSHTMVAYERYLQKHPRGRFAAEARSRFDSLKEDDKPFQEAESQVSPEALQKFLADFPGHRRSRDAEDGLRDLEGQDIVDLLAGKKVEVEAHGSGIESLALRIRRRVKHPITVRIPVGSFFNAHSGSAQNMVATQAATLTLRDEEWVDFLVEVACANLPRDIPGDEDTFSIWRSPNRQELVRLMPMLEKTGADSSVRQAAVWIVTDDATYDDLGTLVSRPAYMAFGGTRVINEEEPARAMKVCSDAGIDVTRKAIWQDREQILKGVQDPELRQWIRGRSRHRG